MRITRRETLGGLFATLAGASLANYFGSDDIVAQSIAKAKPLNLKIVDLKVFMVAPRSTFVKVYTNQGLVGLGQSHFSGKEETVAAAILQLGEQLVGRDPTAIEANWEDLYEGVRWRGGPLTAAISAVDTASWDILGQALGQPIYKILGGPIHDRIKCYDGGGGITQESWEQTKANGYTISRVGWPQGSVTAMIKYVHQLREACGPDHELAVHGSGTMPTSDVVQFMRGVEDCNLLFVEEPLQMDDIEDWVHLRAHTTTPIATGERVQTLNGFTPYLQRHLIDFAQPDLHACGGITEARKIAAVAAANRIRIAPHGPQGPVGAFANMHFDAATPNFYVQETRNYTNQADMDMHEGLVPQVKNGYCELPDKPGLGTVLNEKVAAQRGGPTYQIGNGLGLRTGRSPQETTGRRGRGPGRGGEGAGGRGGGAPAGRGGGE
jgi:L-alanine-DL-glutamate epimerase-like enolase superfamily enzyme